MLSKDEVHARHEIYLETYAKQINIEALASIDMVKSLYIPAVIEYTTELATSIDVLDGISVAAPVQQDILERVNTLLGLAYKKLVILEKAVTKAQGIRSVDKQAVCYRDEVFTAMNALRKDIDALETLTPRALWPVPTYADLLFNL